MLVRDYCRFACLDDKHRIKVGEPAFPVAAAERGRSVLVRLDEVFAVGDHDFTKFGIIPSVILLREVPQEITGSWYDGEFFVHIKYAIIEPSSPLRDAYTLEECTFGFICFKASTLCVYRWWARL